MTLSPYLQEVAKRRTFAIISHPDAGKTTITEKVLLFGQAIQTAGTVKGRGSSQHAKSDWMEMEKQRGISITTSVMQFPYKSCLLGQLGKVLQCICQGRLRHARPKPISARRVFTLGF